MEPRTETSAKANQSPTLRVPRARPPVTSIGLRTFALRLPPLSDLECRHCSAPDCISPRPPCSGRVNIASASQSSLQVDSSPVGGLPELFGGRIKAVSNIADHERAQADPCNYHQNRIPFIRLRRINEFRANNCHVSSRYAGSPLGALPSSPLQKMLSAISDTA
jgi:hypothetical protein